MHRNIAAEKAGIIKPGARVVSAAEHLIARVVIRLIHTCGQVDLTELFDFPTIFELARHLEGKLAQVRA